MKIKYIHINPKPQNIKTSNISNEEDNLVVVEKRRATKIISKMFANKLVQQAKIRKENDPNMIKENRKLLNIHLKKKK